MTGLRAGYRKTDLTLSAPTNVGQEADGSLSLLPEDERAASEIDAELQRIHEARRSDDDLTADVHTDHLIDFVWGDPA